MDMQNYYKINIYEKYQNLLKSGKDIKTLDNNDLWKIFEWYSCIKLTEEHNKQFYEYDDIEPEFKELNRLSRNDTGIDLCDLSNTIVQCKLRSNTLNWKECSTFFGSQVIFDQALKSPVIRWSKLIITRNKESKLSDNLKDRLELFIDKPYAREEIINYCQELIANPPAYPKSNNQFVLRDYQRECINLIKTTTNTIICIPTGTGKNSVIIHSFSDGKKYLILVPRIILMDQLKEEIIKHKPGYRNKIQLIGDTNNKFNESKLITICVFNSVGLVEQYGSTFEKIYVDEAHHIDKPEIYTLDDHAIDDNPDNIIIEPIEDKPANIVVEPIDEAKSDEESDSGSDSGSDNSDGSTDEELDGLSDDEQDNESTQSEELIDDTEDELKETTNYLKIIKTLTKHNNNVYLSATIDEIPGFAYYKKDIRYMIDSKYLCDYTIHVPIFSDDPTNKNICEYLIKNYRHMIIYCNSQKEGTAINTLLNTLQPNSSEYIDCNTPKKKRQDIIKKYKDGLIPFLVNVRILVEGFDAPITRGVVFLHLPSNKTTLIQIIGRCLRLHASKTIANIILPFSSSDDEKPINNFLQVMARNDTRIKKAYESKRLGGYINITYDEQASISDPNIELRYEMIYNSTGVMINAVDIWEKKLEDVKAYIDTFGKRPSSDAVGNIGKLGKWVLAQTRNYKLIKYNMKNDEFYKRWEKFIEDDKYKTYFMSNQTKWINTLDRVKTHLEKGILITAESKNMEHKILGSWLQNQRVNYRTNARLMKHENIKKMWVEFVDSPLYKKFYIKKEDKWSEMLSELKTYIQEHNSIPSWANDKILYKWYSRQKELYKYDKFPYDEYKTKWVEFINDPLYKKYFITTEEELDNTLLKVKEYIRLNNAKPTIRNQPDEVRYLCGWVVNQQKNYKMQTEKMKVPQIREKWRQFIEHDDYRKYFLTAAEEWDYNFEQMKKYIETNNKKLSIINPETKQLCSWFRHQKHNYKYNTNNMKEPDIYNRWTAFIQDPKYSKYV